MRKQVIYTALSILLAAISFSGCKKSNDSTTDNSASLKNTVWTGGLNYPGKAVEPVSMSFADGGALLWSELKGDFNGSWSIENGILTISIEGSPSFKADVSGGKQLINIKSSDPNGRVLISAVLNTNEEVILDNTTWTAPNLVLKFKAGGKVDMTLASSLLYKDLSYVRKGKSIRFAALATYKWFLVTNNSSNMTGANSFAPDPAVYPFVATKQ